MYTPHLNAPQVDFASKRKYRSWTMSTMAHREKKFYFFPSLSVLNLIFHHN